MFKAYKYRIYPNEEQENRINQTIGVCRLVYNLALEVKVRAFKSAGKRLSAYDLCSQLVELKKEFKWIADVDSQSLLASVAKVDVAFSNFFIGKGYPKFKSKRLDGSFQCPTNTRRIDWERSTLTIPKIKDIPIILSRKFDGKIKTVTISKTATGKYFASILVDNNDPLPNLQTKENALGIDLGISNFAILSTGEKIDNPRYFQGELKRLKILQRRASNKKKGSKNRKKALLKVALLHEKISNQRKDFLHKLSTKLISDNQTDTICVESLAVSNMVKNRKLSQAISDVSWGEFIRQLEYKGKWYGKNVIKINRFYASSKTCSSCGHIKDEMNLSERTWICSNCGSNHDRDINAAINIKNSGMGSPVEPVELLAVAGAKKQELEAKQL